MLAFLSMQIDPRGNFYWNELPPIVQQQILNSSQLLEFKRGESIYSSGDSPEGLFYVKKGLVGLVILGLSGKEHLLRFFKKDQFFGHRSFFAQERYHGSTLALESTQLLKIPKETVLNVLKQRPEFYRHLIEVLSKELRRCEVQHVMILENQILARTAQSLIYLKELHPDHSWTRQEIANFCASTVSTVIKALAQLESMGLIRQNGRSIEILDREALINFQDKS